MYLRLYGVALLGIIFSFMLIRQCLKPSFINPDKVMRGIYADKIVRHMNTINHIGRICAVILTIALTVLFIVPAIVDTVHINRNEYVYEIVETTSDWNRNSYNSKYGHIQFILHTEFIYDPELEEIRYVPENELSQTTETPDIAITDYEKGNYYLVRYLPYLTYGEVILVIDDIEQYKT